MVQPEVAVEPVDDEVVDATDLIQQDEDDQPDTLEGDEVAYDLDAAGGA